MFTLPDLVSGSTEKKPKRSNWNLSYTFAFFAKLSSMYPTTSFLLAGLMSLRNPFGTSFISSGFLCLNLKEE